MPGRERRVEPFERNHAARRQTGETALEDAVLDARQALAQQLDQAHRLVLRLGVRADRGDRVEDALDARRLEADDLAVRAGQADRLGHVAVRDGAHVAQLLGQDQVRVRPGQRRDVEPVDRIAAMNGRCDAVVDLAARGARDRAHVGGEHRECRAASGG